MSFVRNTLSLLATTAFIAPLRLVTVIVLARLLVPDDLGVYTITITFATISMLVVQIGLPSSAIYRIRRLGFSAPRVAGSVLLTCLVVGGVGAGLLLLGEPFIAERILPPGSSHAYRFGIVIAFLQLVGTSFVGVARGIDRFDLANYYRVINAVGQLGGLLLVLGAMDGGTLEALGVVAAVHVLASGFLILSVVREVGISFRRLGDQLAPGLRYGIKSHAQALAGNLHEQIDVFMLAYLIADPSQIAIYSIAVGVLTRLKLIPVALADALFPEIAGRPMEEGSDLAARAARHSLLGVSLVALGLALIAPLVVPLAFGPVYRSSVPVFLILLPGMVMLANFLLLGRFFMAINRQQVSITIQTTAVLVNVALNLVLIPRFGITGAAIASTLSYTAEFLAMTAAFVHSTDKRLSDCVRFRREDAEFYLNRLRHVRARWQAR